MSGILRTDEAEEPTTPPSASTDTAALERGAPRQRPPGTADSGADGDEPVDRPPGLLARLRGRPGIRDIAVCVGITLFAVWLTRGLWPDPASRVLALNPTDQALDEWFLAHGTRLFTGDFDLVTRLVNAPDGINVMANASLILLGVIMTPVTLAFGAPVSFAVVVAGNLAATGAGWYLLFARTLRLHRLAAILGGALAGFAPGIVSQSNAHPHISAQWLVAPIVWCVIRLSREKPGPRLIRIGALLGVLVTLHVFLGEEVLFLTAVTLVLFCLSYAALAPRKARRLLPALANGLVIGAGLATVLLVYFLWIQFAGPQSVPNSPFRMRSFSADVLSYLAISPLSLAGDPDTGRLAAGPAEYNTFFGTPLLLVVAGTTLWLWRRPVVAASASAAAVMCLLALGPRVVVDRHDTGQAGLYALIGGLPVVEGALPSRFALAAVPLFAIIIALAVHTALARPGFLRLLVPAATVAALVPIAPLPLPTAGRAPVPEFISQGYWRSCVPEGGVLVPVPLPKPANPDTMRWSAAANAGFGMPQGFFIGPYARGGRAAFGIFPRPTSQLLDRVARTGEVPPIGADERAKAAADAGYWTASCLVLADQPAHDALKSTMDALYGPGERVADVWIWRVTG